MNAPRWPQHKADAQGFARGLAKARAALAGKQCDHPRWVQREDDTRVCMDCGVIDQADPA